MCPCFILTSYCIVGTVWGSSYWPVWISDLSLVPDFSFRYDSLNRRTAMAGWNTSGVNILPDTITRRIITVFFCVTVDIYSEVKIAKIPQEGESENILILILPKNLMLVNVELFILSFYTNWCTHNFSTPYIWYWSHHAHFQSKGVG